MTEQRANWLQRLVGADGAHLSALEEQLLKAGEERQQLAAELAHARAQVAMRDQQLEEARDRARAAEQDFEARLVALREASDLREAAHAELEKQHRHASGEVVLARAQLARQRDEAVKLTKSLAATGATLERAEAAHHAARGRATELEQQLRVAQERAQDLEQGAQAHVKTTQALHRAESERQSAMEERDLALTLAQDAWRALERVVGDAAPLALSLGVDTGAVEGCASLEDATAALEASLERRARCQAINVDAEGDALYVELSVPHLSATSARWLVAFTTAFLEKALGVELAVETTTVEDRALAFSLRKSATVS